MTLSDVTLQKKIDEIYSFLQEKSWAGTDRDFFEALAEYLCSALGMDFICIDKINNESWEAETVAVYVDGQHEENMVYKLEDTPCGEVVQHSACCYPRGVATLFPGDLLLQELKAESYTGITLRGSDGGILGLIAAIGRKPLLDTRIIETVLKQVSIRVACELEHRRMEEAIIQSRDNLKHLVEERTATLRKTVKLLKQEINIRKRKEKSLALAEEKYRTVADFTYDWETWYDPDGSFRYVSPSCQKITGYNVEEFMEDPDLVVKIAHPDDREAIRDHYQGKLMENPEGCTVDFRIITRSGEERWIGHSCQPVYDSKGKWVGQRGSNRDITERKNAEKVLMDSKIHLRALMKHIDDITEHERTKIAREIHDELGHQLTSLKFDIESLANQPDLSSEQRGREFSSVTGIVDNLIRSVRKIATDLRPGILDHLGLIPALEWQLNQFCKRTGISCTYDLSIGEESFSEKETSVIFRIFQEILTNIARHSKANEVSVNVVKENPYLMFIVADNGIGFKLKSIYHTDSLGLMGMRERALSVGGEIKFISAPGKGTRIILSIPRC